MFISFLWGFFVRGFLARGFCPGGFVLIPGLLWCTLVTKTMVVVVVVAGVGLMGGWLVVCFGMHTHSGGHLVAFRHQDKDDMSFLFELNLIIWLNGVNFFLRCCTRVITGIISKKGEASDYSTDACILGATLEGAL